MVDINELLRQNVEAQQQDRKRREAKAHAEAVAQGFAAARKPGAALGDINRFRVNIPEGMHFQPMPWNRDAPPRVERVIVDDPPPPFDEPDWNKPMEQDEEVVQPGPAEFRTRSERSTRLPRFKLKYDTAEECNLRLNGTVITVQDQVVYIQKVSNIKQDGHRGLGVIGYNRDGQLVSLLLDPNGLNLRTLEPGYIQAGGTAYMFRRKPARVYKQGLNQENTIFSKVGSGQRVPLFGGLRTPELVKAFEDRPVIQWDPSFFDDDPDGRVQSKRLSDRIAVYRKNKNLKVEHRGYDLGYLREGTVYTECDNVWVNRALEAVGLKVSLIK